MTSIQVFIVTFFLAFTFLIFSGCTEIPWLKKHLPPEKTIPREIIYTVPKWQPIGVLSEELPTVTRVLKRYTGSMNAAMIIVKSNHWKYDKNFYQTLPFGINIYIAEDGELFIDPKGGESTDEVIIKRKPNPEYYASKKKSSRRSSAEDIEIKSPIIEEDLIK